MHGIARITRYTTLAALGAGMASAPAGAQENTVSVTVYNQNFALVKDVRRLELTQGTQEIRIDDVAAQIEPTSVHFAPLDRPGQVAVLEQNFQYDLAGPDRLLDRYLDRDVTLVQKDGTSRNGRLLSYNGGSLVLAQPGGGAVIVNRGEVRDIAVGELPGGLVTKPTLVWTLASDVSGPERAEVSYLTNGIGWHAEYVAVVNQEDTELSMDGWVSLDNRSGATYPNARLKLVAGDVRRVQDPRMFRRMDAMPMAEASAGAPQFEERDFFEYHIYTLERPATIADRETKQLSLFPPANAGATKVLVYDGQRMGEKVEVRMEFENSRDNGLGIALPAGTVRVYKEDADGALEFAGEDRIDHTPRDEKVRLALGNAFDVKGERRRVDFQKVGNRSQRESIEIKVRNHKDEDVEVVVVEHLGGDWTLEAQSHPHRDKDAHTIEFVIPVSADGETVVTYTVRTNW